MSQVSPGAGPRLSLPLSSLVTPALLVRASVLADNLAAMRALLAGGASLRAHAKTHKSAEIARLQLKAGSAGITTATAAEALALARAGIDDLLVANQVAGRPKIDQLLSAARSATVTVAADDPDNARDLSDASQAHGVMLGVLIEIDVGMGRGGCRDTREARELARTVQALPGVRLRGVMGYEGHCMTEPDAGIREGKAREAMRALLEAKAAIESDGIPVPVVSAGGTNTAAFTGRIPGVTEIQAGSYALMDAPYNGISPTFGVALTVLATVVSAKGPTVVVDAGYKTMAQDNGLPQLAHYQAQTRAVNEEHTIVTMKSSDRLRPGDQVELITGHCCGTVNLHDRYYVVEDDTVVEMWPILARGAGGASSLPRQASPALTTAQTST